MGRSVNVDDTELTYSGNWDVSGHCVSCSAVPNREQLNFVNDGTWHDASRQKDGAPVSMSYSFEGTGVVVYGITINGTTDRPYIKNVDLAFSIDDAQEGVYQYAPNNTVTDYHLNVPFFTKTGLNNGPHTLTMALQPHSFVLLDYLIYYKEEIAANAKDPPRILISPSPSSSSVEHRTIPSGDSPADNVNITRGGEFSSQTNVATSSEHTTIRIPSASPASGTSPSTDTPADREMSTRGAGLSTGTRIALAVLIPILAMTAVLTIWNLRARMRARRAASRQSETDTQLPAPPPRPIPLAAKREKLGLSSLDLPPPYSA